MAKIEPFDLTAYPIFLIPSFLFFSLLWSFTAQGKLYYCSDPLPIIDIFPPFIHEGVGDYWIAAPDHVYIVWAIFVALIFIVPLLTIITLKKSLA